MELKGHSITKWQKLKTEIIKRPFLTFTAKLSEKEISDFFINNELPSQERLEEINDTLLEDREIKTEKLRQVLSIKVGHRGSVRFANKIGVSDTTIRGILDKKYKSPPSYDLLGQIELFLLYTEDDYKISLEHLNISKDFLSDKITQLKEDATTVADVMRWVAVNLSEMKLGSKQPQYYPGERNPRQWVIDKVKNDIDQSIERLKNLKLDINFLLEDFAQ